MSKKSVDECDNCGKRVDDVATTEGWIITYGEIARTRGMTAGPLRDMISGGKHFCSLTCLIAVFDKGKNGKLYPSVQAVSETYGARLADAQASAINGHSCPICYKLH